MFRYSIYDLWGTFKYYEYEEEKTENYKRSCAFSLHPFLIYPRAGSNKKPYVSGSNDVILDDVVIKETGDYKINEKAYKSISNILMDVGKEKPEVEDFVKWVNGEQAYIRRAELKQEEAQNVIIPIPDRLYADSQDAVLKAFSVTGKKRTLLWRSVAAFLGNEDIIFALGKLKLGDRVVIVDYEKDACTVSNLYIDECDGRLIPAHHIFRSSDDGKRIKENYPFGQQKTSSVYSFPYYFENGFLKPKSELMENNIKMDEYFYANRGKVAVVVGKIPSSSMEGLRRKFDEVIFDESGSSISLGSAKFASRMRRGVTSYYDECEALSLVVTKKTEEIIFSTLIEADKRLKSGTKIEGKTVEGVAVNKGTDGTVKFYLRLGEAKKNLPLRLYEHKLNLPDELLNMLQQKTIDLKLMPSMVAGQGRATVEIVAKEKEFSDVFPPIALDWEKMEKTYETVSSLEAKMDRSFPVDIAPTKIYDKWNYSHLLERSISTKNWPELNRPKWPNQFAEDTSRFDKLNVFGAPTAVSDGLPHFKYDRDIALQFFNALKTEYNKRKDDDTLKAIAWTYHPNYFEEAYDDMLSYLKECIYEGQYATMPQINASFYANMLQDDESVSLFWKAFVARLGGRYAYEGASGINNWLRPAYQVLMANTAFLEKIDKDLIYQSVEGLISTFYISKNSSIICGNICRTFLFLLKYRRFNNSFCKEDPDGNSLDGFYYAAVNLMASAGEKDTEAIQKFLNKYKQINEINSSSIEYIYDNIINQLCDNHYSYRNKRINYNEKEQIKNLKLNKDGWILTNLLTRLNDVNYPYRNDWGPYLKKYLNGKGKTDLPIGD